MGPLQPLILFAGASVAVYIEQSGNSISRNHDEFETVLLSNGI